MCIDFDDGPLIDDPWLDETIALPLLDQLTRPSLAGPRSRYLE